MESYPWIATNTSWCYIRANGKSNITGATLILTRLRPMPLGVQLMRHTLRTEKAACLRFWFKAKISYSALSGPMEKIHTLHPVECTRSNSVSLSSRRNRCH
jgi:hypothetical protein